MSLSFTQEQIDKAYDSAPELVQEALVTDPYLGFAIGLQTNYKLHVDIAGSVTGLMRALLLGLINPTQFVGGLAELDIPQPTVTQLVTELNEKVFKPLQEQMKEEGTESAPQSAQIPSAIEVSVPVPTAPIEPPTPVAPEIASVVAPPIRIDSISSAAPLPAQPAMRTMTSDMNMAKENPPSPMTINAIPAPSAYELQRRSAATAAPQPIRSVASPYTPLSPQSAPTASQENNPHREELRKIVKEYTTDPYHEPI